MNVDLVRKTFCLFGLRGTGKSTLANHIAEQYKGKALVYDTLHEAPAAAKYYTYCPVNRNDPGELERVIALVKDNRQFSLLMIDEANRFCPSKPAPLPGQVADLNDQCRHYGMSVGYIARRPSQLNQDLTELSDYLFVFRLTGVRDIKYLNEISAGLGDSVLGLKGYQFVLVLPDRSFRVQNPIAASDQWLRSAKRHLTGN